uniref:Putative ionotropic receptor 3 n=1 Tax=Conopomorpha sinensis TaxID=940481 RepID=A0A3S7SGS7_9NEOP|nr:putative ionotropic receptor 3 [Conopomorpha sinensis]
MLSNLLILCFVSSVLGNRVDFLKDFILHQGRSASVVSFVSGSNYDKIKFCKEILLFNEQCAVNLKFQMGKNYETHKLYVADYKHSELLLNEAYKTNNLIYPNRWIIFYDENEISSDIFTNSTENLKMIQEDEYFDNAKRDVEMKYAENNIGINTEVYFVFVEEDVYYVFLVYKLRPQMPLVWEKYGDWSIPSGFDRPHPVSPVAMRRRDLKGYPVVSTAVYLHNQSYEMSQNYIKRDVDTLSKVVYYMSRHLVEWVGGTHVRNTTDSWGYLRPDGTFDGIVRELYDGRSDFSSTVLIMMRSRLSAVEYILPPAPLEANFVFKKPSLAAVTNIYVLPFSRGVWVALCVLMTVAAVTLFAVSFKDEVYNKQGNSSVLQRASLCFHDTLCLVFQQGTAFDPDSISARQILLLGLMSFMFLYTAYSANVVALLQSASSEINNVETLLRSPLGIGAEDVIYNRQIFEKETRPAHRALYVKKGLPQGERFFMTVEEGVRRMREGMFAFHSEPTATFDEVQRTFLEHEKCNLGSIKFTEFLYPYFGIGKTSHIKEVLRIGVIRIAESGVQVRTNRRMMSNPPKCVSGTAMFTAVRLLDILPAVQSMFVLYAVALIVFGLEIYVHRRELRRKTDPDIKDRTPEIQDWPLD